MTTNTAWSTEPERGNLFVLRLMANIGLKLGWHAGHAMLFPVAFTFMTTAPRLQREAARRYLTRALGRKARWRDEYRLYFAFSSTLLDRVFLLTGRSAGYKIEIQGREQILRALGAGRGLILLGAHIGNFDALRAVAGSGAPVEIRALMHLENAPSTHRLFNSLDPARAAAIIRLGRPEAMLEAKECLDRGGMLGILGDRAVRGERSVSVDFLGVPAPMPAGPIQLAAVLGAPVFFCVGIWLGPRRYVLRFESFAERVVLDRSRREAALAEWLGQYAGRLEALCRAHPYNWFNFFDFWQELPKAPP